MTGGGRGKVEEEQWALAEKGVLQGVVIVFCGKCGMVFSGGIGEFTFIGDLLHVRRICDQERRGGKPYFFRWAFFAQKNVR